MSNFTILLRTLVETLPKSILNVVEINTVISDQMSFKTLTPMKDR